MSFVRGQFYLRVTCLYLYTKPNNQKCLEKLTTGVSSCFTCNFSRVLCSLIDNLVLHVSFGTPTSPAIFWISISKYTKLPNFLLTFATSFMLFSQENKTSQRIMDTKHVGVALYFSWMALYRFILT